MSRRLKIGCGVIIVLTALAIVVPLRLIKARVVEVEVEAVTRADVDETVTAVPVAGQVIAYLDARSVQADLRQAREAIEHIAAVIRGG